MSENDEASISLLAQQFLHAHRDGHRMPLEDWLERFPTIPNTAQMRTRVIDALSHELRSGKIPETAHELVRSPPSPELPGYAIIDAIGQGAMGIVFEAYQQSTGRRVAIKCMLPHVATSETARRRFQREVELVARLNHPAIVSILDSGIDQSSYYYAMEYVDGRPINQVLATAKSPVRTVLSLVAEVADAVEFAHQHGVLHRDLKPANILLQHSHGSTTHATDNSDESHARSATAPFSPKVLDFGLAKAIDTPGKTMTLSEPGQILGTLGYMSPEQARGEIGRVSVRSDVYSLGAILYELLTGNMPCRLDGPLSEVLNRIEAVEPPAPSAVRRGLDRDIDAIVLKALRKEPELRYASAAAFAGDIRRHLAHETVLARPAGPLLRMRRWARRNRAIAAVMTISAGILAVTVATSFWRVIRERDRALRGESYARKQFLVARDSIDRLVFDTNDWLRDVSGTEPIRNRILMIARDFVNDVSDQTDDLNLDLELGPALGKIGDALREQRKSAEAGEYFRRSRALAEQALRQAPDDVKRLREYAFALLRSSTQNPDRNAQKELVRESEAHFRKIAERLPQNATAQAEWAAARMRVALAMDAPDGQEALQYARDSLNTQSAVALAATDSDPPIQLARLLADASEVARKSGQTDVAAQWRSQSVEELRRLALRFPTESKVAAALLRAIVQQCESLLRDGQPERACEVIGEARQLSERLLVRDPANVSYRVAVIAAHGTASIAARRAGRMQEAIDWTDRALALARPLYELDPDDKAHRRRLADLHLTLGHLYARKSDEQNSQSEPSVLNSEDIFRPALAIKHYQDYLELTDALADQDTRLAPVRAFAWRRIGDLLRPDNSTAAAEAYANAINCFDRHDTSSSRDERERQMLVELRALRAELGPTAAKKDDAIAPGDTQPPK